MLFRYLSKRMPHLGLANLARASLDLGKHEIPNPCWLRNGPARGLLGKRDKVQAIHGEPAEPRATVTVDFR
jgi:hypothetical protein